MKNKTDPRHYSRVIALQKLFERQFVTKDISKGYKDEFNFESLKEFNKQVKYDRELLHDLLDGVERDYKKCDKLIQKYAPAWPLEQISKIDLQILRIALYEGYLAKITPIKVAIDEAVELAKEYGGINSGKFVNGVLGNLLEKNK